MKHKVSELEGALLDAAVAMAEGDRLPDYWRDPDDGTCWLRPGREEWSPSDRWDQGGPIIERNDYLLPYRTPHCRLHLGAYSAQTPGGFEYSGATPLIAAMRAYVASNLGAEVALP